MATLPLNPKVQSVGEAIGDHMDSILSYFKPGAKITVLVRRPDAPDGSRDFVQTNDTIDQAIAALMTRKTAPTIEGEV